MKVAVVVTSHMRCWKQQWPYFKRTFIDQYNPDIYLNIWETEGWWKWGDFYRQSPTININDVVDHYNPKKINVETYEQHDGCFLEISKNYSNAIGWHKNMISQMYMWKQGISMIDQQYDLIIRVRSDVQYTHPLPQFKTDTFYTSHMPLNQGGLGDMIHVGNQEDMTRFCNIFNSIDQLYQQTKVFCLHLMAQQHVKNLNLKWEELDLPYILHNTPWGRHQDVTKFIGDKT